MIPVPVLTGFSCCLAAAVAFAPETASREARFAAPPASTRLLPIRHRRPDDRARADAEIDDLVRCGYGGMVVNAPPGKDYLVGTNGWETFRRVVRTCREKGLSLWLYDEDGYPSGTARDLILRDHPEWTASGILVAMKDGRPGETVRMKPPPGELRRTFICPLQGDRAELSRIQAVPSGDTVTFPQGTDCGWRALVVSVGPVYEGSHASCNISRRCKYPNLLMREPTAEFIRVTHERYARDFGNGISAFTATFTDEPSLMTFWFKPMDFIPLPWSEELAAGYAAKTGRDLLDDVPYLVCSDADGRSYARRHDFWSLVAERVAGNYFGQIRDWCHGAGLASGGHLLWEEAVSAHVGLYGDFFRCLRALDCPGVDCLTSIPKDVPWRTARFAGSAGALNGARHVMCEVSDHCQRYREPGNAKPVRHVTEAEVNGTIARLVWGGVNVFTSYYVFDSLDEDAQRRINLTSGRLATLMSEGVDAADVAVLYPADALMSAYEPSRHFGGGAENAQIAKTFCEATESLYRSGRPFLIVDADSLAKAEVAGKELAYGPLRWKTVVLPRAIALDDRTLERIRQFQKAGGRVAAIGEAHKGFGDVRLLRMPELLEILDAEEPLPIRGVSDDPAKSMLLWGHRRTEGGDLWLAVNRDPDLWKGAFELSSGSGRLRLYDPRTGEIRESSNGRIEAELPPWAAVVIDCEMDGRR